MKPVNYQFMLPTSQDVLTEILLKAMIVSHGEARAISGGEAAKRRCEIDKAPTNS